MKTKFIHVILLLITISFISSSLKASEEFEKAMLKAKKNLKAAMDKSDEKALIKVRGEFERILQLKEEPWLVNYYIAFTDYGLAMLGNITTDKEVIKKYTESGINVINKSIDANPEFADSYVLLEALNFNRWQYEQEKMQDIINASQAADESAKKLEPENPRYVLITSIASFYTPEMYGGGVKVALPGFEKADKLFKSRVEKSKLYPDWGHEMALGYLALSLIQRDDEGDMKKAMEYIEEAKKINPDSGFINKYVMDAYDKKKADK